MSTPSRLHSLTRQSTMPCRSLRRGLRTARLSCPPAHGIASSTMTSWPRSPATRAASSPPGPAPTITTRRRRRRRARSRAASSARGWSPRCGGTAPRRRRRSGRGSRWRPTQGRISASRPSMILRTMCGSARWARVMPTRSTLPSRMACRADATSSTFEACSTARLVLARTIPAKSRCGTDAHAVDRDHLGQCRLVLDVAADDVDEVDQARLPRSAAASAARVACRSRRRRSRRSPSGCRR